MDNTSDGDVSSLPVEVVSEVEVLGRSLQDLDLGRRKQILEELVKHPLHELEHALGKRVYTESVIQRVAYVMRGRVPGAFAAAIATGCYAEELTKCYLGGCTFALEPPAPGFDAGAFDLASPDEKAVSIMVGQANTAGVCRQGWPHGLVIDLDRARERGFTIRPWREDDHGPAALLRRYSQLRDLVKAAPPDPLPPGNDLLCRVLAPEQLRHFDGLHWRMLLSGQPRLLLQASPASPGSSPDPRTQPPEPPPPPPPPPPPTPDEGRRWSQGLIKPYPWLPCYKEWVVFLLYLGLVVPFDDGMPLLCLSWLPYALAAAGYCGDDLYQRFLHGEFRDTRAIAAERPEGLPENASAQDARAALAACARCASSLGARRPPTPPSVGGVPAAGSLLEPVLTPELLEKCAVLAQRFPQPGPAQGTALVPPNFYDRTARPPNTFEGHPRPEGDDVLLLCYVVAARRDVHQRMQDVLGIDCDDSNFFLAIRGSMMSVGSHVGLQLEAQLGLPCGFFDQLFYRDVRRGSTGFWGVGVFDAKQVAGAVEIAEDETYVMPSSSFAGFSPYMR